MQDWTFQQIEGPEDDRKKIVLGEWNAPFGRPRKDPVVKELIKSRIQTTRYPGGSGQTRHAFGTNWEPMELKGRWMSKANRDVAANDIANEWVQFVRDEKTCRISWGNIISWQGFIEELELARESEHEIAWRLRIQVDGRDDVMMRKPPKRLGSKLADDISFLQSWVNTANVLKQKAVPDISPSFLDSLDNLAADLNKPSALLNKLANEVSNTQSKAYATLQHFRGAVAGMRNAVLTLRETVLSTVIDAGMLVRTAESDLSWARYVCSLDAESLLVLEALARMDRELEIQMKVEVSRFITAVAGDTWESLSTRATGSPSKAGDIRSLNGARYGEKPVVGTSYLVQ